MTADLIAKLQAAESGSRELDDAVWWPIARLGPYYREVDGRRERNIMAPFGQEDWRPIGPYDLAPALTTSLDAITALIGEKLLRTGPVTIEMAGSGICTIDSMDPCRMSVSSFGKTPALACCLALLRALSTHQPVSGEVADG